MDQRLFLCQVINKNGLQDDLIWNGYWLYKPELIRTSEAASNIFNVQKCEYMLLISPDILLFHSIFCVWRMQIYLCEEPFLAFLKYTGPFWPLCWVFRIKWYRFLTSKLEVYFVMNYISAPVFAFVQWRWSYLLSFFKEALVGLKYLFRILKMKSMREAQIEFIINVHFLP